MIKSCCTNMDLIIKDIRLELYNDYDSIMNTLTNRLNVMVSQEEIKLYRSTEYILYT